MRKRKPRQSEQGKLFLTEINNVVHLCQCAVNKLCQCQGSIMEDSENVLSTQIKEAANEVNFEPIETNAKINFRRPNKANDVLFNGKPQNKTP